MDTQGKTNVNVCVDGSSIDVSSACAIPYGLGAVAFKLSLLDSPTGAVTLSGTPLDSATMSSPAAVNEYAFDWTHNATSLDASRATNGIVSVVWDALGLSGYGTFDNLVIEASNSAGRGCSRVLSGPGPSLVPVVIEAANAEDGAGVPLETANTDDWDFSTGPD